jgi:hypothetical protein
VTFFSSALQSGQLGPLIQQFGLGPGAVTAANAGDLEAFLRALDEGKPPAESPAKDDAAKKPAAGDKKKDDDDDDHMAVD